ncbi:hypothetical protein [Peribacillus sp. SCS-37]|uniref:hypothetical protein n=1 Tax=Paraperibacillus esterisolvens TaxID=3115296 RepID=UPI003906CC7D
MCVYRKAGIVVEKQPEEQEENAVLQMVCHYYICQLSEKSVLPLHLNPSLNAAVRYVKTSCWKN